MPTDANSAMPPPVKIKATGEEEMKQNSKRRETIDATINNSIGPKIGKFTITDMIRATLTVNSPEQLSKAYKKLIRIKGLNLIKLDNQLETCC